MIGGRVGKYFYHVFIASRLNFHALLRGFMEYAEDNGTLTFPAFSSPLWHEFLLTARKRLSKKYPDLENVIRMGAKQERCLGLNEVAFASWHKFHSKTPEPQRIKLAGRHAENPLTHNYPGLKEDLYEIAKEINGFLY